MYELPKAGNPREARHLRFCAIGSQQGLLGTDAGHPGPGRGSTTPGVPQTAPGRRDPWGGPLACQLEGEVGRLVLAELRALTGSAALKLFMRRLPGHCPR